MTLKRRRETNNVKKRIAHVDGDDIRLMHVGFEVSEEAWKKMQEMILEKYGDMNKKSQIMRILLNAVILKIIDIDDLDKKIEKAAEKVDYVIYI